MRVQGVLVAAATIFRLSLAFPGTAQALNARQNASAPCAVVSSRAAAARQAAPSAAPVIEAQLALDCLNSVPLRSNEAVQLVDSLRPYVEWQSDLAYLKSPPPDYPFPSVDIVGSLDSIKTNIAAGSYKNEYEFQTALFQTFNSAHDGHFSFYPDAVSKAFVFRRQVALVSVSKDGVELPKIYTQADIAASVASGSTTQASAITMINDIEASKFIQDNTNQAVPLQDPDAGYNAMFFSRAQVAGVGLTGFFVTGGPYNFIFPGATTKLTFENGTSSISTNSAVVRANFAGVVDGDTFYQKFCTGPPPAAAAPPPSPSTTPTSSAAPPATSSPAPAVSVAGYPAPVIVSSDAIISGYYLTEPGTEDVAVLSVLDFSPQSPAEFQMVTQKFLADAKAAGKKKLIVDLSANSGGFLFLGYDLFRQFFPQITQDGNSRFRQNAAIVRMSEIFSAALPADFNPATSSNLSLVQISDNFYNARYDLDVANNSFPNVSSKFNGRQDRGDTFTTLIRRDMNDPLSTSNTTFGLGIDITGYGNRTNFTQQFAAQDIVMVYDGFCASTCTMFSEFMRLQGGVKSVAFGGRPTTAAIQGIGGVKGAQSYSWASLYSDVKQVRAIQADIAEVAAFSDLPLNRSTFSGLNLRDHILAPNFEDGIPAQFVQEPADCRLYWTPAMITNVTAVWNAAAKAAFAGGNCVAGAISNNTTRPALAALSAGEGVIPTVVDTEVIKSLVELTKDPGWDTRHGQKLVFN